MCVFIVRFCLFCSDDYDDRRRRDRDRREIHSSDRRDHRGGGSDRGGDRDRREMHSSDRGGDRERYRHRSKYSINALLVKAFLFIYTR